MMNKYIVILAILDNTVMVMKMDNRKEYNNDKTKTSLR